MEVAVMRICRVCKDPKTEAEFKPSNLARSNYICRACDRDKKKEYRKRPHVLKRHRNYNREYMRRFRANGKRDPEQHRAHTLVRRYFSSATERDCQGEDCSDQATIYHHPNGYAGKNALDVVPLCHRCHRVEHGILK